MTHLHDPILRWYRAVCGEQRGTHIHDWRRVNCPACLQWMKDNPKGYRHD